MLLLISNALANLHPERRLWDTVPFVPFRMGASWTAKQEQSRKECVPGQVFVRHEPRNISNELHNVTKYMPTENADPLTRTGAHILKAPSSENGDKESEADERAQVGASDLQVSPLSEGTRRL
jgi:hypothetical protein